MGLKRKKEKKIYWLTSLLIFQEAVNVNECARFLIY